MRPGDETTRSVGSAISLLREVLVPGLTILCHPDHERVGEQAVLAAKPGKADPLSRMKPAFTPCRGGRPRGLEDPHVSRRPTWLTPEPDGAWNVELSAPQIKIEINGEPIRGRRRLTAEEVARGVVLVLSRRVALLLRTAPPTSPISFAPALVGEGAAVTRLRSEIRRVADLDYPVLLRGESGTGKELVARAIHEGSPRADGPFIAVNLGAVPRELAVAELFGAVRGAFTGAHRQRKGFFKRADGGTLFLDEVGEAPPEVQVSLLRALEEESIQPVGAERGIPIDVRVISATDADLEAAAEAGEFRLPLFHRLSSCEILLPPLRERREDFGRLFFYFLKQELAAVGESHRLTDSRTDPWIPADLVGRLALLPWHGNVRKLRNVVRQLVVESREAPRLQVPPQIERQLAQFQAPKLPATVLPEAVLPESVSRDPVPSGEAPESPNRSLRSVSDDELLAALRAESFNMKRTAERLKVSRSALYKRMDRCPLVRKASELERSEIEEASRRFSGNTEAMASHLEVSPHGLTLRIRELRR